MANNKILYICQQIMPYLPENEESYLCRQLSQAMQERSNEIRTFMPRYGCVNERRNQLHEVIRLSGMNLIINDNDHQLIIKVSSIPSARIQIYFIDNDDFFARKALLTDEAGKEFDDNGNCINNYHIKAFYCCLSICCSSECNSTKYLECVGKICNIIFTCKDEKYCCNNTLD